MFLYVNTFTHFCTMSNKVSVLPATIPETLRSIKQPPKSLYYRGNPLDTHLQQPRVAIVGARRVTSYGAEVTKRLASDLAKQGIVIVSGLAFGVDAIAHRAALDADQMTVAILPTSIGNIYPRSHHQLAERICKQGTLLSEIATDTAPHKYQFIARNRLIAAMSDLVVVTEAAEGSGSLHTARFAREQNKIVAAVPGNITNPLSVGTNTLIREGARLITSAEDILGLLNLAPKQIHQIMQLTPEEQRIIQVIQEGANDSTAIISASQLPPHICSQLLTMLEIKGVIYTTHAGAWHIL